jgi:hypothetical protein
VLMREGEMNRVLGVGDCIVPSLMLGKDAVIDLGVPLERNLRHGGTAGTGTAGTVG